VITKEQDQIAKAIEADRETILTSVIMEGYNRPYQVVLRQRRFLLQVIAARDAEIADLRRIISQGEQANYLLQCQNDRLKKQGS
jgi:hypothetical protein